MYNPNYMGWICPICQKCFSPYQSFCPYCNQERQTFASTNIKPFDDIEWWKQYDKNTCGDIDSIINSWKTFTIADDIEITPSGAYIYHGTDPEVYYDN